MKKGFFIRLAIVIIAIALSVFYLIPTFKRAAMEDEKVEKLQQENPEELYSLEEKAINLGLDLQGGMHLVLGLDKSKLETEEEKEDALKRALEVIRNRVDEFGVREPIIQKQGDDRIIVQLAGIQDEKRAKNILNKTAYLEFKLVQSADKTQELFDKIDEALAEDEDEAEQDTTGDIQEELAKSTLLEDKPFSSLFSMGGMVSEENLPKAKNYLNKPKVKRLIPRNISISWGKPVEGNEGEQLYPLYLIKEDTRPQLTGADLENARVDFGEGLDPKTAGKPFVSLTFTDNGGDKFAELTGNHTGQRLAIILDGVVQSAPNIQEKIRGGKARITGNFAMEEATDLKIVLRAGALPIPLIIEEERTVGPTLGQDSINSGIRAALIGLAIVVAFMIVWYKGSGIIANIALAFNMLFILAVLAGLGATLTLPGIAGIILTIGMAVDANVLIFERVREELRTGKTVRAGIDAGYSRAFRTILDANLTTLITALVLYQFGTGPIKGFAVTLSIGIVCSMFAAIVITRLFFDFFVEKFNIQRLSI